MISANDNGLLQPADDVDDLIRICAVPDEIAQHQYTIETLSFDHSHHGRKRFQIRMQITYDQVFHDRWEVATYYQNDFSKAMKRDPTELHYFKQLPARDKSAKSLRTFFRLP